MIDYKKLQTGSDVLTLLQSFSVEFCTLSQRVELTAYAEKLAQNANVVAMLDDGVCVGMAAIYTNDMNTKTAYISLIGIRNKYQGTGLGSQLLDYCASEAQRAGMEKIRLEVDDDNANAQKFYRKHGFVLERTSERNSSFLVWNFGK
ncbi:MAG: GNAT family N-acetyltransferase [Faecalibacterium sp.]|nr:GNAT family N-acetyltransferase [Faecalibacterium sp.]